MMRAILAAVVLVSLVLSASTATAQDDAARAKEHYDRGAALYFQGDYGQAVLEFMRAYDALPEPVFMYNIAMSHWRLGNLDKAIEAGNRAAAGEVPADLHAQIVARTTVFYRLRHIEQADWSAPEVAVAEPEPDPEPDLVAERAAPPPRGHALRWVGVGAIVAGAGLLAGFTVVELGLQAKVDDYEAAAAAGDREQYDALRADIESGQPLSLALLWSGVGLAAVGTGLIVFDLTRPDEDRVSVIVTPTSVGVRAAW